MMNHKDKNAEPPPYKQALINIRPRLPVVCIKSPDLDTLHHLKPKLDGEMCPCGERNKLPGGYAYCNRCLTQNRADRKKTRDIADEASKHPITENVPQDSVLLENDPLKTTDICGVYDEENNLCTNKPISRTFCQEHLEQYQSVKKECTALLDSNIHILSSWISLEIEQGILRERAPDIRFIRQKLLTELTKWDPLIEYKICPAPVSRALDRQSLIYSHNKDSSITNLSLVLEIVNEQNMKIFRFIKDNIRRNGFIGKAVRFLLKDTFTGSYLGLLEMRQGFPINSSINKIIGWTTTQQQTKQKFCATIDVMGVEPTFTHFQLQEFFNTIIFSDLIQAQYQRTFGNLFCAVCFVNQKEYDYTTDFILKIDGTPEAKKYQLPHHLLDLGVEYINILGYDVSDFRICNLTKIVFRELNLEPYYNYRIMNDHVYLVLTANNALQFLQGKSLFFKPDMKPLSELIEGWKQKVMSQNEPRDENNFNTNLNRYDYLETQICQCMKLSWTIYGNRTHELLLAAHMRYTIDNMADMDVHKLDRTPYEQLIGRLTPSYLGGLFDGDGSMIIQSLKTGFQLVVCFPQSSITILQVLRHRYGGYIMKGRWRPNQRQQYVYRICGRASKTLLEHLAQGCILKAAQAENCLRFLDLLKKPNCVETKSEYHIYNQQLNRLSMSVSKPLDRLNMDYIAGIFDAEGCVFLFKPGENNKKIDRFAINICQKNHPIILEAIHKYLDYGHVRGYYWIVNARDDISLFVNEMIPRTIVKTPQLYSLQAILHDINTSIAFDNTNFEFRSAHYQVTQQEKHESDIIDNLLMKVENNQNKIVTRLTKLLEAISENIACQKIRHIKHYNLGSANPNHGGLSKDHRVEISLSRQSQSKEDDQKISRIRELLDQGNSIRDVAKTLKISKKYISEVKSGYHVQTSERNAINQAQYSINRKDEKAELKKRLCHSPEDEQLFSIWFSAKGKRAVPLGIYLNILTFCRDIIKNKTRQYYNNSNILSKFKGNSNLTRAMVYQLLTGKSKLYKFDFNEQSMSYDEYLAVIKNNLEYKFDEQSDLT